MDPQKKHASGCADCVCEKGDSPKDECCGKCECREEAKKEVKKSEGCGQENCCGGNC